MCMHACMLCNRRRVVCFHCLPIKVSRRQLVLLQAGKRAMSSKDAREARVVSREPLVRLLGPIFVVGISRRGGTISSMPLLGRIAGREERLRCM